jgi:hypothetical protein
MSKIGGILGRLGASVLHVVLNTLLIMVTGKYFGTAWERMGRSSTFESGEALLVVAIFVAVPTVILWQLPIRRRVPAAAAVTACAIAASGIGSYFLGTYRVAG